MLVADLDHFLDLPPDSPGSARRLAEQLSSIVRAATAADVGVAWETALPCQRRPAHKQCPGRMIVAGAKPGTSIRWHCGVCEDAGSISNWEDSPYDLRRRSLTAAEVPHEIVVSHEVAAALRDLHLLDPDSERLVFGIRAHGDRAVLAATDDDLEELLGSVAAEANHECNRRRRQRLDAAFDVLNDAAAECW